MSALTDSITRLTVSVTNLTTAITNLPPPVDETARRDRNLTHRAMRWMR